MVQRLNKWHTQFEGQYDFIVLVFANYSWSADIKIVDRKLIFYVTFMLYQYIIV